MGFITYNNEYTFAVSPSRLFKALKESHILIPKLVPQSAMSIEVLHGNGGVGTLYTMTVNKGDELISIKIRIDEINEETLVYKYTYVEGDPLMGKFKKISNQVQYFVSDNGGTLAKIVSHYYPLRDDVAISEEEIKAGKESASGLFKVVEGYLLQNPQAYS